MSTTNFVPLVRRLALISAVIGLGFVSASGGPHGIPTAMAANRTLVAAGVPPATSSFYVYGSFIDTCGPTASSACPLYADGASEAVPPAGGMTILDFGAPCFEPATLAWGTQLLNSQSCTPDSTLVTLAEAWLRGYQTNANRTASTSYVLVAGTSNSLTAAVPGNALSHDQMSAHAEEWFTSVVRPIAEVAQSLGSQVTIWAGNDIEESNDGNWYDAPTTIAWVDAYAAASGASKPCVPGRSALMADYGDYVPNAGGWSAADVYHVAWQAPPACPVPEIYDTANASEWQSLNQFAVRAGLPQMQFTGVLSEDAAGGTLSSSASWNSLTSASGQAAPYLTVIGVTGPIPPVVPDAPNAIAAVAGPGLVTLSWSASAWDGGAAVTGYTVAVYDGSIVVQEVKVSGFPAPQSVIVAGLDGGTPYTFYVSATNRAGTGPRARPFVSAPMSSPVFP